MTINSTSIDDYLKQEVGIGFEYRNGDEGFTANASHYQNILAKKYILTLNFRPLSQSEYLTIRTLFYSSDEYTIVLDINGESVTKYFYRVNDFSATNVGDMFNKGLSIQLKEI